MYAVIQTGGKQYRVREGDVLRVESLSVEVGGSVKIDMVNLVASDEDVIVGTPTVPGAVVKARVVDHGRGPKVIAFKKKRRKGYRRKIGHRQSFTELSIEKIEVIPPKSSRLASTAQPEVDVRIAETAKPAAKKAPAKKAPAKKAPAKKKNTKVTMKSKKTSKVTADEGANDKDEG